MLVNREGLARPCFRSQLQRIAKVLLTVKHMQTEGKIFLRIHKSATMGDVRAKIMEVLDLPRSAFGSPSGEVGRLDGPYERPVGGGEVR